MKTLNSLLEKIIPNKTYLYYVDQNDSLDGYEKSDNISQECMNEHFDLMKKWFFDLWD